MDLSQDRINVSVIAFVKPKLSTEIMVIWNVAKKLWLNYDIIGITEIKALMRRSVTILGTAISQLLWL